jgi:hypothetical protein
MKKASANKVHFVHIYKFAKDTDDLFTFRAFIRDYDGAIKEISLNKKVLNTDQKDGIIGDLPPMPGRQAFIREEHYDISSSESSQEEEDEKKEEDKEDLSENHSNQDKQSADFGTDGDKSADNIPFKRSMDSKQDLVPEVSNRQKDEEESDHIDDSSHDKID